MLNIEEYKKNLQYVLDYVNEINERDSFEIELRVMNDFPDFYEKYPFIVKKIAKKEDISMLYTMLDNIKEVQDNKTSMTHVEKALGEQLAEKYLYPVLRK